MESELRALLERKAEEMDKPRTLPDQAIERIQSRRTALMAAGAALLLVLGVILWRGLPEMLQAHSVRPANTGHVSPPPANDGATVIHGTGTLDKPGWYVIPTLEPHIRFHIDRPGWQVNLNEPDGYFNISVGPSDNGEVMSIVNYSKVFDTAKSLASASARIAPPKDMVSYLRANPHIRVDHVRHRSIGGVPAVQLQVTGLSEQPGIRELRNKLEPPCGGPRCGAALVYNRFFSPVTPQGISERVILFDVGSKHFIIENVAPSPTSRIRALIRSLRILQPGSTNASTGGRS